MIFSRDEMPTFRLEDKEFPMWCDLVVLEKIQEEVGDIVQARRALLTCQKKAGTDLLAKAGA